MVYIDTGGFAFPAVIPIEHSEVQGKDYPNYTESGMTLRDWFAGQFLSTVQIGPNGFHSGEIASNCYRMADAMLAERRR